MLNKLKELAEKLTQPRELFDPAVFNDPLAIATDWGPAKSGGTNFKTHKLVPGFPDKMEFKAGLGAKLFYLIFMGVGAAALIFFLIPTIQKGAFGLNPDTLVPAGITVIFGGIGVLLHYFGTAPIVFDKNRGYFWKGRKDPQRVFDKKTLKHYCELHEIHAIQLISEYIRGDKSSYYSYELNLVLKDDGRRLNVIDHGSGDVIREDAKILGDFLGVAVWDGS